MPEAFRAFFARRASPIDFRPFDPRSWFAPVVCEPANASWFRAVASLGDDPALHCGARLCVGHGAEGHSGDAARRQLDDARTQSASFDHALWLDEPFRADECLLYAMENPWVGHARGFDRGSIVACDGRLIASVAQERLIRLRG